MTNELERPSDAKLTELHSMPYVRSRLLEYAYRPEDDTALLLMRAIADNLASYWNSAALASQVVQRELSCVCGATWDITGEPELVAAPLAAGEPQPDSVHLTARSGEAATGREDGGGVSASDGVPVPPSPDPWALLRQARDFADEVHTGEWAGPADRRDRLIAAIDEALQEPRA